MNDFGFYGKKKSLYHLEKFMMDGATYVHLFNFLYVVYMICRV